MFRLGFRKPQKKEQEAEAAPPRPVSREVRRAELASQMEEILGAVWREERWAQVEDRLDHLVRVALSTERR